MEIITGFLAWFAFIAFIAMLVGMIRPSLVLRWGEKRTRGRVLLYYGVGSFALVSLGVLTEPEEAKIKRAQENFKEGTRLLDVARTAYHAQNYQTAVDSADEATSDLNSAKLYIEDASTFADQAQAFFDSAKAALRKEEERQEILRKAEEERQERVRKAKEERQERASLGYTSQDGTLEGAVEEHVLATFGKIKEKFKNTLPANRRNQRVTISSNGDVDVVTVPEPGLTRNHTRETFIKDARSFMAMVRTVLSSDIAIIDEILVFG